MIKKFFLLFVAVCFLCTVSCGFEDEYSGDEVVSRPPLHSVSEDVSDPPYSDTGLSHIEGYDYGNKDFVIVTTDEEYFKPAESKSLISKAVGNRNGAVETKFNINIKIKVVDEDEILSECEAAVSKGERYADLIVAPANVLSSLMDKGCLININTLPFIDRDATYFNNDLIESSQINGKLYLLFGDITQTEYSSWCVFYNKNIAEKTGTDPYSLYKNGEWTWDAFVKYSIEASKYSSSGFVSTAEGSDLINALWATTGQKFFGDCANTELSLPASKNGKEVLSSIKKIVNSENLGKESGTSALDSFIAGKSGMLLCRRNAVYKICDSGMNWGAVPMPKYNSESAHYSYVDGEALAAAVPAGGVDTDFSGRILNALLAATEATVSQGIMLNELYYYWENNEMAVQMEETKKNLHLDIGIIYAYAVKDIATVTTENIMTALDAGIAPFQFYHSTKNQFSMYASEKFG